MPLNIDAVFEPLEHADIRLVFAYRGAVPESSHRFDLMVSFYTWWWVEHGPARIEIDHRWITLEPGAVVLFPAGGRKHHQLGPETRLLSAGFQACWPGGRPCLALGRPLVLPGSEAGELRRPALALCRLLDSDPAAIESPGFPPFEPDLARACRARAAFLEFVGTLFRWAQDRGVGLDRQTTGDARLDGILARLAASPRAGPLPYDAWEKTFGCSRSQLDRLAAARLGATLRSCRDRLLLDAIRRDLHAGDATLKEIAARYAFADPAHFSRWVRRQTGVPPGDLATAGAI